MRQLRDLILKYHPSDILGEEGELSADYRYEIVIYWSEEDGAFIAEVPELPGCMADGPTYRDALAAAEEVIGLWIEAARDEGRGIPAPKGRRLFA